MKKRILLITTIIYVFNSTFAQNIQYGKKYKSAIIFFGNGPGLEVKNLELLDNNIITFDNATTDQKLSEISLIQVKKGTASKGGVLCAGSCGLYMVSIALRGLFGPYEYKQYNEETKQDEIIKEPGISTREVILYTAIFSGISYGIGWLGGNFFNVLRYHSLDDWEVIYTNQNFD